MPPGQGLGYEDALRTGFAAGDAALVAAHTEFRGGSLCAALAPLGFEPTAAPDDPPAPAEIKPGAWVQLCELSRTELNGCQGEVFGTRKGGRWPVRLARSGRTLSVKPRNLVLKPDARRRGARTTFADALFKGLSAQDAAVFDAYEEFLGTAYCAGLERHGFSVDADRAARGTTVLSNACYGNRTALATKLITEHSADVNRATTDEGVASLYIAAQQGHIKVCELLIEHGADLNMALTRDGATPTFVAAHRGHANVCKLLAKHNADLDRPATSDGSTPLLVAAQQGHIEVCELLVEHGADLNRTRPGTGVSPILVASEYGHIEVCALLVERDADLNRAAADGTTPILLAAEYGHIAVCELLIEYDANIHRATRDNGATAILMAAQNGHMKVCALLVEHSADLNRGRTADSATPLHVAAQNGHVGVCTLLVEHGAVLDRATTGDGAGITPLMLAAYGGHLGAAQLIAAHGASLATESSKGHTASAYARMRGQTTAVAGFLDAVDAWPALKIAAAVRQPPAIRRLLRDCSSADADPAASLADARALVAIAITVAGWPGAPAPCRATTALTTRCTKPWSPERHWLFHGGVRAVVHTLLLVEHRLRVQAEVAAAEPRPPEILAATQCVVCNARAVLLVLPKELWLLFCTFAVRRNHRNATVG